MPVKDTRFFEYLPVSDEYISWGLYVTGAGEGLIPPHREYPPQDHPALYSFKWQDGRTLPEYTIVYITEGAGTFESKPTGKMQIKAGTVFLLFPDIWHTYRPDPEIGWREYWVALNGKYLYHLAEQGIISPKNAVLYTGVEKSVLDPFKRLLCSVKAKPTENSLMLSVLCLEILVATIQAADIEPVSQHAAAPAYNDPLVNDAIELIWSHSHRKISVSAIAGALSTTRRTLIRRFNRAAGRTVSQEITRCRVERAKRLLRETNIPIKQIAFKVGFSSPERMSKVFRRELNTSPCLYRQTTRCKPRTTR